MRLTLPTGLIVRLLVGGCALLARGPALAQTPESVPATAPTQPAATQPAATQPATTQPATPQPALTVSDVQLQLKQVQEATDIADDAKSKAVAFYTQAIQQLEIADQWASKAAEYDAERQMAPETLRAIQAELTEPLAEPTPDALADSSRADLEQRTRLVQSDLDAARKTLADWERERDRRTSRRKELPELLTTAKARLQTLGDTPATPEAELSGAARRAQQALGDARRVAIEREIEAYNSEVLSYDARRELLQARLDRASRRVGHLEKLLAAWQQLVQDRARKESEAALREAREQLRRAHPAIVPLVEQRTQLALRAKEIQAESRQVDAQLLEADTLLTHVNQDYDKITRRVHATGLTNAISQLLRKHRGSLPNLRPLYDRLRKRKDRISSAQLAMMELEDRRGDLINVDAAVADVTESTDANVSESQRAMIHDAAAEAVVALRTDMDNLLRDYDQLFEKLVDLDSRERELVNVVRRFDEYVDEKILWVKSGTLPTVEDIGHGRVALAWLAAPAHWGVLVGSVASTLQASGPLALVYVLSVLLLWLATPRLARVIRQAGEKTPKAAQDTLGRTIATLAATAGLALRWPATLWLLAWASVPASDDSDFAKAVASGLQYTALIVLTLQSLWHLARRQGLGDVHFRWNSRSLALLQRHLTWLTAVLVPMFLIFATIDAQDIEAAKNSLGRLAFVIAFLAIALFVQRVLRPSGPLLAPVLQRQQGGWLHRLRHIWYTVALALPICLVIAAIAGYYYTALYLGTRFIESVWLLLGLMVLRALIKRWLLLQIRRRALNEARERAALKRQQQGDSVEVVESEMIAIPADKLDVVAINRQTLQLVRVALVVVGAVAMWGVWSETLPALGVFRNVTLWNITQMVSETVPTADGGTQVNEYTAVIPITLANTGIAALIVLLTIVAVQNIPGLLEITILQHLPIDAGGRYAATAITRYALTVMGVIVAFAQIGVGWSSVQWLVAAMTVGLGFGLQEIFANLVSGLMLLFERPIRIGDTVTVGEISGTVSRIRTRATTIVAWDRKELIIPNKEFITGNVVNWTLSDSTVRLIVPVGIAYGSDTQLARDILKRVVRENAHVLDDPAPRILFMRFGASSLDFEVRAYIGSVDYYLSTIDELTGAIDHEFRRAKIEIAFPQRDIHIRSIHDALPLARPAAAEDRDNQR